MRKNQQVGVTNYSSEIEELAKKYRISPYKIDYIISKYHSMEEFIEKYRKGEVGDYILEDNLKIAFDIDLNEDSSFLSLIRNRFKYKEGYITDETFRIYSSSKIMEMLQSSGDRGQMVIQRFGIDGEGPKTLEQLKEKFNLNSSQHVAQKIDAIIKKISYFELHAGYLIQTERENHINEEIKDIFFNSNSIFYPDPEYISEKSDINKEKLLELLNALEQEKRDCWRRERKIDTYTHILDSRGGFSFEEARYLWEIGIHTIGELLIEEEELLKKFKDRLYYIGDEKQVEILKKIEKIKAEVEKNKLEQDETEEEKFLKTYIGMLELSPRALNSLSRGGINTVEKLIEADVSTLKKVRNLGAKTLEEVLEIRERLIAQVQPQKTDEEEPEVEETELTEEQKREKFLNEPLYELDLSARAYNCLARAGIDTKGKLLEKDKKMLMSIRNLGKNSLEEVLQAQEKVRREIEPEEVENEEINRKHKEEELARYMQEDSELDEAISKAERLEQIQENGNKTVDE